MTPKCLNLLEAGAGIEPTSTALQAGVFFTPKSSIHAGFRPIGLANQF